MIEAWAPTIISVAAMAGLLALNQLSNKRTIKAAEETNKETRQVAEKAVLHLKNNMTLGLDGLKTEQKASDVEREHLKEIYLRKDSHQLLCKNATLSLEQHITTELTALKDEIFEALRSIESAIKRNGNA